MQINSCLNYIVCLNKGINMIGDISCVFDGIDHRGAIYISGIQAAQSLQTLKDANISAVLSVARSGYIAHSTKDIQHYLYLPAEDHQNYDISQFFQKTYEFIDQARKQTNVLIHCMAGISRSATITAAYLIVKFNYSMRTVLDLLQRKRRKISPNPGFLKQLKELQTKKKSKSPQRRTDSMDTRMIGERNRSSVLSLKKKISQNTNLSSMKCIHVDENQNNSGLVLKWNNSNPLSSKSPVKNIVSPTKNSTSPNKNTTSDTSKISLKIQRMKRSLMHQIITNKLGLQEGIHSENCQDFMSLSSSYQCSPLLKLKIYKNKNKVA